VPDIPDAVQAADKAGQAFHPDPGTGESRKTLSDEIEIRPTRAGVESLADEASSDHRGLRLALPSRKSLAESFRVNEVHVP